MTKKATKKGAATPQFKNLILYKKIQSKPCLILGYCQFSDLESESWLDNIHAEAEAFALGELSLSLNF